MARIECQALCRLFKRELKIAKFESQERRVEERLEMKMRDLVCTLCVAYRMPFRHCKTEQSEPTPYINLEAKRTAVTHLKIGAGCFWVVLAQLQHPEIIQRLRVCDIN